MLNKTFNVLFLIFIFNTIKINSIQAYTSPGSEIIDVLHYSIHINVNMTQKNIKGYTELKIIPKINNTSNIPLDLLKLYIDSIKMDSFIINNFSYNDTLLNIIPVNALNIGDTVKLKIYYHGKPQEDILDPNRWGGFHFETSIAYNMGVGFNSNPHNFAKVWFPCIDDFTDKATYDFFITVDNSLMAVCGGILEDIADNGNGTKTCHWKLNTPIAAYLASVAVGNYIAVKDTFISVTGKKPVQIWVKPSDTTKAKNSFRNLKSALSIFETKLCDFKWQKAGYVSTTLGAMEHATNVAYPTSCIDGSLTYEWLFVHELGHSWFGNLVTCSTAEDMWLNEGMAVFCESLFQEYKYGKPYYKQNIRKKHHEVLQLTHIKDNGYRALYGIPHDYTYGSTVYDKGGIVTHTLRGYLGDSLFFKSIRAYLNQYSYKSASSEQLRDVITATSGINMTEFFNTWVYAPGFPHYSLDSFKVIQKDKSLYNVTAYVRQKHRGNNTFANSNRIEITFMDENWNKCNDIIEFSGEIGSKQFTVPFNPTIAILDIEEKIADATTDCYYTIKNTGYKNYPDTYLMLDVQNITDSAFVRVEHNWVAPDDFKTPITGLHIANNRYWKIDGIFPAGFITKGRFSYSKQNYLDNDFINNSADSLVMLWRKSTSNDWKIVRFSQTGNDNSGLLIVDTLQKGEYAMAIWNHGGISKTDELYTNNSKILIYPNPTGNVFNIKITSFDGNKLIIYSTEGKELKSFDLKNGQNILSWKPQYLPEGTYFIYHISKYGNKLASERMIYVK